MNQKGKQKEVRAPSTGSNMSQPRVHVGGGSLKNSSHHSSNAGSSNIHPKRYDSIEHQRQSQINKFLQSP